MKVLQRRLGLRRPGRARRLQVFTMTFRCPATGFDLCEVLLDFHANYSRSGDGGQVTEDTVRTDIEDTQATMLLQPGQAAMLLQAIQAQTAVLQSGSLEGEGRVMARPQILGRSAGFMAEGKRLFKWMLAEGTMNEFIVTELYERSKWKRSTIHDDRSFEMPVLSSGSGGRESPAYIQGGLLEVLAGMGRSSVGALVAVSEQTLHSVDRLCEGSILAPGIAIMDNNGEMSPAALLAQMVGVIISVLYSLLAYTSDAQLEQLMYAFQSELSRRRVGQVGVASSPGATTVSPVVGHYPPCSKPSPGYSGATSSESAGPGHESDVHVEGGDAGRGTTLAELLAGRNEDGSYQVDYDDGDKWYNVPQAELAVLSDI
ncbi:hypothetical protein AK812_SmicGene10342 [Symbiodinium microadriaticum]|uniref:Uncharacterized protein n=1 Tax=Symbiodinium microadriaticum TaxID=2951 RepID=A0A1Q9EG26_SYMMI|nr:hypothetical protein AK812_SmicGene10342 [Symbiodinium microadriaticum]